MWYQRKSASQAHTGCIRTPIFYSAVFRTRNSFLHPATTCSCQVSFFLLSLGVRLIARLIYNFATDRATLDERVCTSHKSEIHSTSSTRTHILLVLIVLTHLPTSTTKEVLQLEDSIKTEDHMWCTLPSSSLWIPIQNYKG